jgi:hypothetical protein
MRATKINKVFRWIGINLGLYGVLAGWLFFDIWRDRQNLDDWRAHNLSGIRETIALNILPPLFLAVNLVLLLALGIARWVRRQ